jgi:hypothetical protein
VFSGLDAAADRYPGRAEAIALLETTVEPEVIAALRASLPNDPEVDPGRDFWIERAKEFVRDLRRIKADPELGGRPHETQPGQSRKERSRSS